MSDMFDSDELVDLHPRETNSKHAPQGYRHINTIFCDMRKLAQIIQNEYPPECDEYKFAQKVLDSLKVMGG